MYVFKYAADISFSGLAVTSIGLITILLHFYLLHLVVKLISLLFEKTTFLLICASIFIPLKQGFDRRLLPRALTTNAVSEFVDTIAVTKLKVH